MKKVAILAAPGFEEIELMAPLDILRRLNMDVVLAGVQSDKVVSTHEVTVSTDTMLDKLHADKLDALILPGGAGSWVLRDTPEVIHLVKKMHEAGKLVAAICAAPIVLAKAGLVRDRNVTAYPAQDVYRELNEAGAHIVKDENVVLDGNMLTANSTFSWWAAWLNEHAEKIVIAPRIWFNREEGDRYHTDDALIPGSWLRI